MGGAPLKRRYDDGWDGRAAGAAKEHQRSTFPQERLEGHQNPRFGSNCAKGNNITALMKFRPNEQLLVTRRFDVGAVQTQMSNRFAEKG